MVKTHGSARSLSVFTAEVEERFVATEAENKQQTDGRAQLVLRSPAMFWNRVFLPAPDAFTVSYVTLKDFFLPPYWQ